jgi:hypothetical protein
MATFIAVMHRGVSVQKHGRRGLPKTRTLWLTDDREAVRWQKQGHPDPRTAKPDAVLQLADVAHIETGGVSAVLRRSGKASRAALFLTLVAPQRTLDLELSSEAERDMMYHGLETCLTDVRRKKDALAGRGGGGEQKGASDAGRATTHKCPRGHTLAPHTTVGDLGFCDGCSRILVHGTDVMDCTPCDYFLCDQCDPRAGTHVEEGKETKASSGDVAGGGGEKTCPQKHVLTLHTTESDRGTCDGCSQSLAHGTRVMDCTACDYFLCDGCDHRARPRPRKPSIDHEAIRRAEAAARRVKRACTIDQLEAVGERESWQEALSLLSAEQPEDDWYGADEGDRATRAENDRVQFARIVMLLLASVMEAVGDGGSGDDSTVAALQEKAVTLKSVLGTAEAFGFVHGDRECTALRVNIAVVAINALEKHGETKGEMKGGEGVRVVQSDEGAADVDREAGCWDELVKALALLAGVDALGGAKGHHVRYDAQVVQFDRIKERVAGEGREGVLAVLNNDASSEEAIKAIVGTLRSVLGSADTVYGDARDPRYFDLQLKVSALPPRPLVDLFLHSRDLTSNTITFVLVIAARLECYAHTCRLPLYVPACLLTSPPPTPS